MDINEYLNELEIFKIPHGKFPNLLMQKFGMSYDEAEHITELHKQEMAERNDYQNSVILD